VITENEELRAQLAQKTNLLQLGAATLKLTTEMGREHLARIERLRAALTTISGGNDDEAALAARSALDADDAQEERDNAIPAVDTATRDLFGDDDGDAAAMDALDAARFRWLTEDHADAETREHCRELLLRMPSMTYSAASRDIDAAMRERGHG
jgi:hypothetical protein